ncbi:MAG: triose-phosphate isomerase [Kiritimatiellae bacterium]|jgi:triosephosphate isomerase|nr:triose-phosphate isomerase [Kiritimatiellia bacterium]
MRKKIIAGNWKMNVKPSETATLVKEVVEATKLFTNVEVVCCTPAIDIPAAVAAAAGTHVGVGAENAHWEEKGAFTGEISTGMLVDAGAKYVIIGHSERRQYFGETDETVNKRTRAVIASGLTAIVCVGETLEEREAGKLVEVIERQMNVGLKDVTPADCERLVIAYEPVWAIGTGKTATPDQAQEVHALIRATLAKLVGAETAETVRIQYGGSMKPTNAAELLAKKDIDGGLIGGAALKAADFAGIVAAAN